MCLLAICFLFTVDGALAVDTLNCQSLVSGPGISDRRSVIRQPFSGNTQTLFGARTFSVFDQCIVTAASEISSALSYSAADTVQDTVSLAKGVTDSIQYGVTRPDNAVRLVGTSVGNAFNSAVTGTIRVAESVTGIVAHAVRSTLGSTVQVAVTLLDTQQRIIQYATSLLGTPYKWGGSTTDTGLDCSGFVREVVHGTTGITLPRTAREMSRRGTLIEYTEMQPGDLVFFDTRRRPFSHVGIYLGDGRFVHGASGKKSGKQVRIDSFESKYYRTRFNGARRIDVDPTTTDGDDGDHITVNDGTRLN